MSGDLLPQLQPLGVVRGRALSVDLPLSPVNEQGHRLRSLSVDRLIIAQNEEVQPIDRARVVRMNAQKQRVEAQRQRTDLAIGEFTDRISLYSEIYTLMTSIFAKDIDDARLHGEKHTRHAIQERNNEIDEKLDRFILEAIRDIESARKNSSNFHTAITGKIKQWNTAESNFQFHLTLWAELKIICFHLFIGKWAFAHIIRPFIFKSIEKIRDTLTNPENTLEMCKQLSTKGTTLLTTYMQQKQIPENEEDLPEGDEAIRLEAERINTHLANHFLKDLSSKNSETTNRNRLYRTFCSEIMDNYFPSSLISSRMKYIASLSFWQPTNVALKGIKLLSQALSQALLILPILLVTLFEKILDPIIKKRTKLVIQKKFPKMIPLLVKNIQIEGWEQATDLIGELQKALAFSVFMQNINFQQLYVFLLSHFLQRREFSRNVIDYLIPFKNNSTKSILLFFKLKDIVLAGQNDKTLPNEWNTFAKTPSIEHFEALLTHIFQNPRSNQKFECLFNWMDAEEDRYSSVSAMSRISDSELFPDLYPEGSEEGDIPEDASALAASLAAIRDVRRLRRETKTALRRFSQSLFDFITFETCPTRQHCKDKRHRRVFFQPQGSWRAYNELMDNLSTTFPKAIKNGIFSSLILGINEQLHPDQLESQLTLLFQTMTGSFTANGRGAESLEKRMGDGEKAFKAQIKATLTPDVIATILPEQIREKIWGEEVRRQEAEARSIETEEKAWYNPVLNGISAVASAVVSPVKSTQDLVATRKGNIKAATAESMDYLNDIIDGLSLTMKNSIIQQAFVDRVLVYYTDRNLEEEI